MSKLSTHFMFPCSAASGHDLRFVPPMFLSSSSSSSFAIPRRLIALQQPLLLARTLSSQLAAEAHLLHSACPGHSSTNTWRLLCHHRLRCSQMHKSVTLSISDPADPPRGSYIQLLGPLMCNCNYQSSGWVHKTKLRLIKCLPKVGGHQPHVTVAPFDWWASGGLVHCGSQHALMQNLLWGKK